MKALLFIGTTTGTIYSAMRWDLFGYLVFGLFLTGGAFLIFISIYRHLAANRYL